jgi:hypothetical protein
MSPIAHSGEIEHRGFKDSMTDLSPTKQLETDLAGDDIETRSLSDNDRHQIGPILYKNFVQE